MLVKRKTVWKKLREEKLIPTPDHLNKEKFPSYRRTPEEDLVSILTTGSTANLFYAKAEENIKDFAKLIKEYEDLDFLVKATLYARNKGFTRTLPILAAVEISRRDPQIFERVASRIMLNPKDWQTFIDIARSKLIRQGLGRAIKRAINTAIANMSVYHAIKYPRAVRDMINIAHPHESVNPVVIRYIKKKIHEGNEQLEMLKMLKTAESETEIVELIEKGKLPYEVVTGSVKKMTPAIWRALLYQAPYFNLIRNLNNFGINGVFNSEPALEYAYAKITNSEAIRNSKLFPFRYYIAYLMLRNFPGSSRLRKALQIALEKSVENVPKISGKVAILADASSSMSSSLTGDYSVVQCIDLVGLFTGIIIRKAEIPPIVLPFSERVRYDIASAAMQKETIFEIAKVFSDMYGGGTSLSAPIKWLIAEKEPVDTIIAFTDNEEWVGEGFLEAFLEYKQRVAPHVKAYFVTLLPYRDYPVPPQMEDVYFVFGWNDNVLRYITTDPKKQMEEIRKIEY